MRDKLKEEFVDLGEKELKNIPRPIRVYALKSAPERFETDASTRGTRSPPPLSIVVLPFANLGGDPEQDYFVDGVTESLTTDLSRIGGSVVIGRHTAFTYKNKAVDLKQIGRELNVQYVLEGSVQRGGNRLRVNAQLIDAETGNHIWAERFDKPVVDLLEMQDEIVARLARQLDAVLIAAEARRAERAPDPNSKDLFFQGLAWFNKGLAPNNVVQAQAYFERALAIDPDNVDALAWMAAACAAFAGAFAVEDRAVPLVAAEAASTKALSLAPDHALAHFAMSLVFGFSNRVERAIPEAERSLALDQNFAMAHAMIGLHKLHLDRGAETEAHVQQALRLSPRDAWVFVCLAIAGYAEDFLGRYEEAVAWQRRSIEANGNYPLSHFHLAAALSHLGRLEEARPLLGLGSLSTQSLLLRVFAPTNTARVPHISRGASASLMACARPGCRKKTATRRLAADSVGRSRLMGKDGAAYAHAGKMDEAKPRLGGSPSPQSHSHGQMVYRTFAERAEGYRRHSQGGAAGGVKQVRKQHAEAGAMLVACRLAGLSALGAHYAGVKWRAMRDEVRNPLVTSAGR